MNRLIILVNFCCFFIILATSILTFPISGCSTKDKDLTSKQMENLEAFVHQKAKDADVTLDSLRFLELDTLTKRHQLLVLSDQNSIDVEEIAAKMKDLGADIQSNQQLMSLSSGLSSTLYNNYKIELDKNKEELKKLQSDLSVLRARNDSIWSAYEKTDSVSTIAYQAKCFAQIRRKDRSVMRDTLYVYLNLSKDVLLPEDFRKLQ